jgi:hypothetical protein
MKRRKGRCGASRRRYKSGHTLPSQKRWSAHQLLETLRSSRTAGGPLKWEIPEIDLEEWQKGLTAAQIKAAKKQMSRISLKIYTSKDGQVAGHWSRHERKHRRLLRTYPSDPYVKMVGNGIQFTMNHIPLHSHGFPNQGIRTKTYAF